MVHGGSSSKVAASGTVDMSKAKPVTATSLTPQLNNKVDRSLKTPAQLAAYRQYELAHLSAFPHPTGPGTTTTTEAASRSTNMDGGGASPVLLSAAAGLNSSQTGGNGRYQYFPTQLAIGTVGGLTIEGVNDTWAGYNSALGVKYGPFTAEQLFAPVFIAGDTFSEPQITWQTSRGRWLVTWLEVGPTQDWIDIAISAGAVPSPLSAWKVYRVDPTVPTPNYFCLSPTMGYDYWGMYVTCVNNLTPIPPPLGNITFAFSISHMESGALGIWDYWYSVYTDIFDLANCGGPCPALQLSPAIEDGGYPQAEYVAATDAGLGVTSSNLTLCAITNTVAVGSNTLPTFSCVDTTLLAPYSDPLGVPQPGTGNLVYPAYGFAQLALRAGRLEFAMTVSGTCNGVPHDFIAWESVDPQLTPLSVNNPQQINGIVTAYSDGGYYCHSGDDDYQPVFISSTEGEATLVYTYSNGASEHPSIGYIGRAATDAPDTIGQCNGVNCVGYSVVAGSHSFVSAFDDIYSACALDYGYFARGVVICTGVFGGPHAVFSGPGWDTEIYKIRMI
jgi:hypothetical protein